LLLVVSAIFIFIKWLFAIDFLSTSLAVLASVGSYCFYYVVARLFHGYQPVVWFQQI